MSHHHELTEIRGGAPPESPDPRPVEIIERPRLLDAIQSEPLSPMVLVAAPAGSGKTALLMQWLETQRRSGASDTVIWVTSEPGEASPEMFWPAVRDAMEEAGIPSVEEDQSPQAPRTDPANWPKRLLRSLRAVTRPVVLILDDFHHVTDPDTLAGVDYLTEHASTRVRIFISARFDPNVRLTKLRLSGQLTELRLADLALTTEEVRELVSHSGLALEHEESTLLRERTEGWVAGVRLCLMSMSASGEPRRIVHELSSNDSIVAGYLIEQVLAEIDPELRTFLLETSIVDVITPSLADQLSGRLDGASKLRTLTRRTGFVVSIGRGEARYRYHKLFADLLRSEFRLTDRARHDELQTRAAELLMNADRPSEAIAHAMAAENWDLAAAALFATAWHSMGAGRQTDLAAWLNKFPESRVRSDPRLCLVGAGLALLTSDAERSQSLLALAASQLGVIDPAIRHQVTSLHAILVALGRRFANDDPGVLRLLSASGPSGGLTAPRGPSVIDTSIRAWWFSMRAASLLRLGLHVDAREAAITALHIAGTTVTWSAVDALETLSLAAMVDGDLRAGRASCQHGLERLTSGVGMKLRHPTALYACQAWMALDEGKFEAAQQMVVMARETHVGDLDLSNAFIVQAAEARIALHRDGDARGARAQMAGPDVVQVPTNWLIDRLAAIINVECLVGLGQYEEARSVAQQVEAPGPPAHHGTLIGWIRERELLSHVVTHGLRGVQADSRLAREWMRHDMLQSAAMATPCPAGAADQLWVRCLLTCALVEFHVGNAGSASRLLNLVLDQVAANGWRLPFYELGDSVHCLLKSERERINGHSELLAHLLQELQSHDVARSSSLVAPLSDRETEILQYLPTVLDRDELCGALFISKNTLKSHLRSIYRKLGADSRREAVHKARSLDLL